MLPRLKFQYASETERWDAPIARPRTTAAEPSSDRERAFRLFANYWAAVDAAQRRDTSLLTLAAPYLAIADSVPLGAVRSPVMSSNAMLVHALVARLTELRSLTEAMLDFPEEEVDAMHRDDALGRLGQVRAALEEAAGPAVQLIAESRVVAGKTQVPAYSVTPPLVGDIPSADRAARRIPASNPIVFEATLAGAIHEVTITGSVAV